MNKTPIVLILGLVFAPTSLHTQTDNTYYAKQFSGATVGEKVSAAQAACSTNTSIPCIIIIDPSLATYPKGTMPTKCAQCVWNDYRTVGASPGALVLNVASYGAVPDGVTDATAAIASAVAFANTQPARSINLHFPPGTYAIDPTQTGAALSITANRVIVEGPGAVLQIKPSSSTPYNERFNVASGHTKYWNYIVLSGNYDTVSGLTFDSNGQTQVNCGGSHGCFWATGVYITGRNGAMPTGNAVMGNQFLSLDGWAVLAGANNVRIEGNYVEKSKGIVCANGTNGCVIEGNISVDSSDAPYAVNGGNKPSEYVSHFVIANNLAIGNGQNGAGIDITAAEDGTVSGNTISGSGNWCIQVDKTSGSYTEGAAGTYIPSQRIIIVGNNCAGNNLYGGWPMNPEILVGDLYTKNGNTSFTPGQTASDIFVVGNTITAFNPSGNDIAIGVGSGATNVTVMNNYFAGCGKVAASASCGNYWRYSDDAGTSNIKLIGNRDGSGAIGTLRTQGSGPYIVWGNDDEWTPVSGNPGTGSFNLQGTLQIGDPKYFYGGEALYGTLRVQGPSNQDIADFYTFNGGLTAHIDGIGVLHTANGASMNSGSGPPSGSCANGSLFTNTAGTTAGGNNLYVCSEGAWLAVK